MSARYQLTQRTKAVLPLLNVLGDIDQGVNDDEIGIGVGRRRVERKSIEETPERIEGNMVL